MKMSDVFNPSGMDWLNAHIAFSDAEAMSKAADSVDEIICAFDSRRSFDDFIRDMVLTGEAYFNKTDSGDDPTFEFKVDFDPNLFKTGVMKGVVFSTANYDFCETAVGHSEVFGLFDDQGKPGISKFIVHSADGALEREFDRQRREFEEAYAEETVFRERVAKLRSPEYRLDDSVRYESGDDGLERG